MKPVNVIVEAYRLDPSIKRVARSLKTRAAKIRAVLRAAGVPTRAGGPAPKSIDLTLATELFRRVGARRAAASLGVSPQTLLARLRTVGERTVEGRHRRRGPITYRCRCGWSCRVPAPVEGAACMCCLGDLVAGRSP